MNGSHPLFGPPAILLWFPFGETPSATEFDAATKLNGLSIVEHWWSVRDAVKYAIDNPKAGLSPWIMVDNTPHSPTEILRARQEILRQDAEDATRT